MKKVAAIIQARCGSSRFPNKVFADINDKPLIWHVVNRLRFSETIGEIILATTINPIDDKLNEWALQNKIAVYRGSENDVLNRYYIAAMDSNADIIVRITADDPFKEPQLIDRAVSILLDEQADFVCNNNPPTFPEGLDVEVFTKEALFVAEKASNNPFEREHVTQYFYRHSSDFKILNISSINDLSSLRWTIDTKSDLLMAQKIYSLLYQNDNEIFHMDEILQLIEQYPEIAQMNANVMRSEMYKSK